MDGVARVRDFYQREGWQWREGKSGDARRWGTATRGPIQEELDRRRNVLLRGLLQLDRPEGTGQSLVEIGGGGQPALQLLDGVSRYTAVDLSSEGLRAAEEALAGVHIEKTFVEADVRHIPLPDGAFDAAYSAHMIYHVPTEEDQRRALREMARLVRPGGTLAVVMSEPYPWLFPNRCLRRAVADLPVVGSIADALRPTPPLPFLPMPSSWMCEVLADQGATSVHCYSVPTTEFSRRVHEEHSIGQALWRGVAALETRWPEIGRRVGCYAVVCLRKSATPAAPHSPSPSAPTAG